MANKNKCGWCRPSPVYNLHPEIELCKEIESELLINNNYLFLHLNT
jgi:hypothetical protein